MRQFHYERHTFASRLAPLRAPQPIDKTSQGGIHIVDMGNIWAKREKSRHRNSNISIYKALIEPPSRSNILFN